MLLRLTGVLIALGLCSPAFAGYGFVRSITIDHTQVGSSDSSNFPLVVSGTYSYLATVANSGNVTSSSGFDIVFTSDSGCSTTLNFERVLYTAASGLVEFWVKVPTVSHTADTVIYECYGNSAITTDQSNHTGTWPSQYKAVYHFQDDSLTGSGFTLHDSTSNANNGSAISAGGCLSNATGQINRAWQQTGIGGNCGTDLGAMSSMFNGSNTVLTWSGWLFSTDQTQADNADLPGGELNWGAGPLYRLGFGPIGDSQNISLIYGTTSSFTNYQKVLGVFTPSINTWYYVVETLDLGTVGNSKVYVNGSPVTTTTQTVGTPPTVFSALWTDPTIFRSNSNTGWKGREDEVRYSASAPSADWVLTEYNNQKTSSTMLTISSPLVAAAGNGFPIIF